METNKLKKAMNKLEDVLAAASLAEEGESDAARSLLKDGRRVLVALKQGRIDARTLKYAVNASKRIGADLDILYVTDETAEGDQELKDLERALPAEGVRYRLIQRTGCLKQAVIEHVDREKEILFAVIESPRSLNADCNRKDTRLSELWQKLKCPLVVVLDAAGA